MYLNNFILSSSIFASFGVLAQNEIDIPHPNAENCEWSGGRCTWDYDLKPMTAMFAGGYNETFYAYVEPDVSFMYNETEGSRTVVAPRYKGQFGKFINMSPETIRIYWMPRNKNSPDTYIADVDPFGSSGTATYPGHKFKVTPKNNANKVLTTFNVIKGESIYIYDPFEESYDKAAKVLSADKLPLWNLQYYNNVFAKQYKDFTGRNWLSLYKQKHPPRYHMWPADSIGQTHTITTKEIHFVELPPERELARGMSAYGPRPDEISRNRRHRDTYPTMDLTLKVLSCAPRVFEIQNFLSDVEIEHIMELAGEMELEQSKTRSGSGSDSTTSSKTRSSTSTWVARHSTIITDAIYRRAADVLKIDEKFLRYRLKAEIPQFTESQIGIAEKLQLVHYDVGQEYTPHHDFSMPSLVQGQPSRFATILFYLNDVEEGGETSFPLWLNGDRTSPKLEVKPEKGKAILFYNLLPDGNYDERSIHAALPVIKGEKWLTNLWIWDPILDHTVADHY